jgi:hypothetical protein
MNEIAAFYRILGTGIAEFGEITVTPGFSI